MRTRSLAWVCLVFVVLALQRTEGASAQPLNFFKNYFVTGDYTVRGVSLWKKGINGKAVANIPRLDSLGGDNGIPATADIVAAFLYLQTAERIQGSGVDYGGVHLTVNGIDLGPFYAPGSNVPGSGTFAKALVAWNAAPEPCWVLSFPGQRRLVTYRADVMRFLPIDPVTRKQALNVPMRIEAPDIGRLFGADDDIIDDEKYPEKTDWMGPRAIGASLVVVYRDDAKPFTGIVLVDGATPKRVFAQLDQTLSGFYEASLNKPIARMTHIVGNGRLIRGEKVVFGSQAWINPYVGAAGPRWDNTTFSNLKLPGGAASGQVREGRALRLGPRIRRHHDRELRHSGEQGRRIRHRQHRDYAQLLRRRRQPAGERESSGRELHWLGHGIAAEHIAGSTLARHCQVHLHRPRQ